MGLLINGGSASSDVAVGQYNDTRCFASGRWPPIMIGRIRIHTFLPSTEHACNPQPMIALTLQVSRYDRQGEGMILRVPNAKQQDYAGSKALKL